MNSSNIIVTGKATERGNPAFYGVPTEELLLDLSSIRQDRLDTLEDPTLAESTRTNTLAYLEHRAAPIIREVKRRYDQRERHKEHPLTGAWPSAERYEKTLGLARQLKHSIPLSAYVHYSLPGVNIQKSGNRWKGQCPYPDHPDTTPSFVVFDEVRFKCFGCQRTGDIYSLVALVDGLERFSDQVKSLAIWAGKAAQV